MSDNYRYFGVGGGNRPGGGGCGNRIGCFVLIAFILLIALIGAWGNN